MESETIVGAIVVIVWSRQLIERLNGKTIYRHVLQKLGENQVRLRVTGEFKAKGKECGSSYLKCQPLDSKFGRELLSICRDFVRIVVPAGRKEGPAQTIRPRRNAEAVAQAL